VTDPEAEDHRVKFLGRLPLEQIGEALDLVRTGRGRKILVAP